MSKMKSTLFSKLDPGDKFRRAIGQDTPRYIKVEKSVSMEDGSVYNTIRIDGAVRKVEINPSTHVFKILD